MRTRGTQPSCLGRRKTKTQISALSIHVYHTGPRVEKTLLGDGNVASPHPLHKQDPSRRKLKQSCQARMECNNMQYRLPPVKRRTSDNPHCTSTQ